MRERERKKSGTLCLDGQWRRGVLPGKGSETRWRRDCCWTLILAHEKALFDLFLAGLVAVHPS